MRNHLNAIRSQPSCGCGDGEQALGALAQKLIQEHTPHGLVSSFGVQLAENGPPDVRVNLTRKPSRASIRKCRETSPRRFHRLCSLVVTWFAQTVMLPVFLVIGVTCGRRAETARDGDIRPETEEPGEPPAQ